MSYGGKSFNLCDPFVLYLVEKSKSERFRKYYKLMCSSGSASDFISSFSKNGKLKALAGLHKGGISIDLLEKFFGKRGNTSLE